MKNKKTLVLGASDNPGRYSYMALNSLVRRGVPTVAVGQKKTTVAGVEIFDTPEPFSDVHTITLYMNPVRQKPYYDYMVSLSPSRVLFNPGTENPELYDILRAEGIEVVTGCTLVMLSVNQY